MMENTLKALSRLPIVVCLRCADETLARKAAESVLDGGLRALEFTLTTPGALNLIQEFSRDPRAIVGAGTVMTPQDAQDVAEAGGRFAMSPVTDEAVIGAAHAANLLFMPGAGTPGEIYRAHQLGAKVIKVFPIGPLGGASFIRAVRGPLPHIPLLPTNGIEVERLDDYFSAGVWGVGVGTQVIDPDALSRGDFEEIRARSSELFRAFSQGN